MKKHLIFIVSLFTLGYAQAQEIVEGDTLGINADSLLANLDIKREDFITEFANNACNCIDSISLFDKSSKEVSGEIGGCIDKQISPYILSTSLLSALLSAGAETESDSTGKPKEITVNVGEPDKNSSEYQSAYFELERYLFENCEAVKYAVAENNKLEENSMSDNMAALTLYEKGNNEFAAEEYDKAIKSYKEAIKVDEDFAFAWDNLGLAYRKVGKYKKAIAAYERSIEIDPKGMMPRQNLAIVYSLMEEYDNAINTYKAMAEIDDTNPEVYYGIGSLQLVHQKKYISALQNMCIAYTLYIEQNSPYRADAEKMINMIGAYMKDQNKTKQFYKILDKYGLKPAEK